MLPSDKLSHLRVLILEKAIKRRKIWIVILISHHFMAFLLGLHEKHLPSCHLAQLMVKLALLPGPGGYIESLSIHQPKLPTVNGWLISWFRLRITIILQDTVTLCHPSDQRSLFDTHPWSPQQNQEEKPEIPSPSGTSASSSRWSHCTAPHWTKTFWTLVWKSSVRTDATSNQVLEGEGNLWRN